MTDDAIAIGGNQFPEQVETERLTLSRPREADLATYCEHIYTDSLVMRTLPGGKALSFGDAMARARANLLGHWKEHQFGPWLLRLNDDSVVIGHCGLRYWPDSSDVELLYALGAEYWGRGLAYEAAKVSLRIGVESLGLSEVIAAAFTDNLASMRVLEKVGMTPRDIVEFSGRDVQMFEYAIEARS